MMPEMVVWPVPVAGGGGAGGGGGRVAGGGEGGGGGGGRQVAREREAGGGAGIIGEVERVGELSGERDEVRTVVVDVDRGGTGGDVEEEHAAVGAADAVVLGAGVIENERAD